MTTDIIGISGSPVKNSNTDRLMQTILNTSGLTSEFVKLSKMSENRVWHAKGVFRIISVK